VNFIDLVAVQKEFACLIGSDEQLLRVNIATRDYIMANASQLPDETLAAEVLVYITPREGADGRIGCGIIVERPGLRIPQSVSPGPQKILALEFLILEDRLINNGPTEGTGIASDWIAQRLVELGHNYYLEGIGEFHADPNAIQAARDFAPLDAWRVTLLCHLETQTPNRVTLPTISADELDRTVLTNVTADAEIFYTTDESMPARAGAGNPGSVRYEAPVALETGTVIRWAAYKNDLLPSHVGKRTITIS
jgi:hypothetical protein